MRFGLVIYGSLETLSGGFLYDRKLVEGLRRDGHAVEVVSLPWRSYGGCLVHNLSPALLERLIDEILAYGRITRSMFAPVELNAYDKCPTLSQNEQQALQTLARQHGMRFISCHTTDDPLLVLQQNIFAVRRLTARDDGS